MMSNYAILDLGTNTFHLLILEKASYGKTRIVLKQTQPVLLRKGSGGAQGIMPDARKRALEVLKAYRGLMDKHQVKRVRAVGTAALRDVSLESKSFLEEVYRQTNIRVEVINGLREAELIYYGVRQAIPIDDKSVLIMDIGGGSVEFVVGNKHDILWKASYPVGAAMLKNQFHPNEEALPAHLQSKLTQYLQQVWQPMFDAACKYRVQTLVGASGSFETLYDLWKDREDAYADLPKPYCNIPLNTFDKLCSLLQCATADERLTMRGMKDFRAPMMPVAMTAVQIVIRRLSVQELLLSRYAMKEGLMWEVIEEGK